MATLATATTTPAGANDANVNVKPASAPARTASPDDFIVRSFHRGPDPAEIRERCAELRKEIRLQWFGTADCDPWHPCCEVIIHPSRSSYLRAVGAGGGQTFGSSLIEHRSGRIATRRIDLLPDARGHLTALHHELTHVVIADGFTGELPPLWVDEGIAMLADTTDKQNRHQQDCQRALRQRNALRIGDLLNRNHLSPHEFPAFYGQSISLVKFLCERDEPAKLVPFVQFAKSHGYDAALRRYYDIQSVSELERDWHRYVSTPPKAKQFVNVGLAQ